MNKKLIIVVGPGGVGKTTVSALLGLTHAELGYRTLVATLDPAQRLSDLFGITKPHDQQTKVSASFYEKINRSVGHNLWVLMPSLKKAWDDFLSQNIPDPKLRNQTINNPFYRYLIEDLPGSLELVSMPLILQIIHNLDSEVIILDTPPWGQGLDFFVLPNKLKELLENPFFRLVVSQNKGIFKKVKAKMLLGAGSFLYYTIERLIGSHFLSELLLFLNTIQSVYDPLLTHANQFKQVLLSEDTQFMTIFRPSTTALKESKEINETMSAQNMNVAAGIINQIFPDGAISKEKPDWPLLKAHFALSDEQLNTLEKVVFQHRQKRMMEEKIVKELKDINPNFSFVECPLVEVSDPYEMVRSLLPYIEPLAHRAKR